MGKFVGGCILTFLGVYLITSARGQRGDDQDEDDLDEENAIGLVDEERYQDEAEERATMRDRILRHNSTPSILFSKPPSRSPHRSSNQNSDGPSSPPRTPRRTSSITSKLPFREPSRSPSPSALLENPWQSDQDQPSRPRPLENTTSTPLLPTEAQIKDPLTPDTTRRQPDSPRKNSQNRPSTITRASVARMMPGPLISPLSSPLSAIIADSLRRGVDLSSPTGKRRPGLSALRQSRSQRSSAADEPSASESSPLRREQKPGMATAATDIPKGRSFSLSLGEFFRLKREKSRSSEGDEEQGERRGSSEGG